MEPEINPNTIPSIAFDDNINDNSISVNCKNCFIQLINVANIGDIDKLFAVTNRNRDIRFKPIHQINKIHKRYVNKHKDNDIINITCGLIHETVKNVEKYSFNYH
ncbi:unnamed protein product, partial [Rotaria sp. Silwood1]